MARRPFSHLHNHSEYSPLDGMQHISDMFDRAARFGQPGVGITDHGRLGGMVEAAKASEKTGVKLVPGLEAYFVPSFAEVEEIHSLKARERNGRDKNVGGAGKARYHMTLLATTNRGYQELMRASTFAWEHQRVNAKFPLFDIPMIEQFFQSGDVIATSGCIGSYANQLYLAGQEKKAIEHISQMSDIFGDGNYYVEVMAHDFPDQIKAQRWHRRISKSLALPLLGTNDTHYSDRKSAHTHQEFLCIQTGDKISSPSFSFSSDENDFCSSDYMESVLPSDIFPGAIDNTAEIVDRTTYKMDISGKNYHIPKFDVPREYGSEREMLRALCMKRLPILYRGKAYDNALDALNYQLGVIDQMGFNGYFLILWDAMNWGRDHGIRFGPGRGSAAGSVVSYCLHITDIDPIGHGLYFERFLNPSRVTMPDIDIDIENARQGELVDYMVSKYGADRVGRLATYMTLKSKMAIKDAARVYEIPASDAQSLADMMPVGDEITVAEAISEDEPTRSREDAEIQAVGAWKQACDLRDEYKNGDKNTRNALECAANVQGYIRGTGIHAAGVVITPGPFSDLFPMSGGDEHALACEYDKHHIDDIGALKFDFLGLKNLDVISKAVERIKADLGIDVDIDNVPLDDPAVFKMLADGDTDTVFQMESPGMTRLAMDLRIDSFSDISACLALYRPGPLGSNIHKQFVDAKRNGGMAENVIHEDMRWLLKETYGLTIFQEQISALAQHYAGYNAAEADSFRKAVGKKDRAILDKQEESFKARMTERGYGDVTDEMWDMIIHFAEYAFNKAHTVSYAKISYQTAWLKHYYPAQFGVGCLQVLDDDKVLRYVEYLGTRGIDVLPPDVNRSGVEARTIPSKSGNRDEDSIILGLTTIASCGWQLCQDIVDARDGDEFKDVLDFAQKSIEYGAKLNKTNFTNLVNSGALDALSLGASRESMRLLAEDVLSSARKIARSGQDDDFDLFSVDDIPEADEWREMATTLMNAVADASPIKDVCFQRSVLGFFIGEHPMKKFNAVREYVEAHPEAGYKDILSQSIPVSKLLDIGRPRKNYRVEGVVISKSDRFNESGNKPTELILEDADGSRVRVVAFGNMRPLLVASCTEGDVIVVTGAFGYDSWSGNPRLSYNSVDVIDVSRFLSSRRSLKLDGRKMTGTAFKAAVRRIAAVLSSIRDEDRQFSGDGEDGLVEYNIFLASPTGRGSYMKFPGGTGPLVLPLSSEEVDEIRELFEEG